MLDQPAALIPSGTFDVAFDIEATQRAFVLTPTQYGILDVVGATWTERGNRDLLLPDLAGEDLLAAFAVPAFWSERNGGAPGVATVYFGTPDTAFVYTYDVNTDVFTFVEAWAEYPLEWQTPEAPQVSEIAAGWVDPSNGGGWVNEDLTDVCGSMEAVQSYWGMVSTTEAFVYESFVCQAFLPPVAYEAFAPLSLAGAPPAGQVGAAFYSETSGLWILRGS